MHMDPPELVDALMEPMMMVVGTMVALSGAYMAIVIDELAARYFRDRDFLCLCVCVCGVGFFSSSNYQLCYILFLFRSSVFYVLFFLFRIYLYHLFVLSPLQQCTGPGSCGSWREEEEEVKMFQL